MITGFAPISNNINFWPGFLGEMPSWLDEIGFVNYEIYENGQTRQVSGDIALLTEISVPFFGIPNVEIAFLESVDGITYVPFEATIFPGFTLGLTDLNISLLFRNEWLVPVEFQSGAWVPIMEGNDVKPFAVTIGGAALTYSLPDNLDFDVSGLNASIDTVELGNTGIVIEMDGVVPYLSSQQNSPTDDPGFRGVGIDNITVHLPFEIDEANSVGVIEGNNLLIGNSGFSGELLLTSNTGTAPLLKATIGGFSLSLTCFSLTFHQNAIVGSNICGTMIIPGFEDGNGASAEIEIIVHFDENGDFYITASEDQGLQDLVIPNILTLRVNSLTVGRRDDRYYLATSGNLDFVQKGGPIGQFLPRDIEITQFIIWTDGTWEFVGGALVLPKAITIPMGPVKLAITALHIGSDERNGLKYKYVGFDAGVSINPSGIDARGDGLKYYFTEDGSDHFFRIEGIGIDMILPGNASEDNAALLFSGYLAVKEGGANGVEYAGSVALSLPRLNISGSASMRYLPEVPAFLVDVGLALSNPIPLGSTGIGIYGFEAMFGKHFVVSKEEAGLSEDTPWFEYYKMPQRGINPDKFYPIGGTSMGAGVLFGTSADSGFTFSSRLFFLLSLPGVFFLEGEAQVLKKRIGFASQNTPPFYAFLAITDSSVEAALGVNYKLPSKGGNQGWIADVTGALELGFFYGNSTGWYVNFGRDLPETKRIQAKVLKVINRAYFYLMLSASGIRAGAGAGMSINKKFGPVKVKVEAYLDLAGRLSFRPLQIGGSIRAGIEGEVTIFGFGIGIGAHFALSVDAPKPFVVAGEVKVCVKVAFFKKCGKVNFKWTFGGNNLNIEEFDLLEFDSVQAINVHTGETYPLAFQTGATDNNVIPLDSYVDIEFKHAMNPLLTSEKYGGTTEVPKYKELLPPKKAKAPQLTYEFEVTSVTLSPEDVFDGTNAPASAKLGFWQWNAPGHYTKLRLLSLSPLSFMGNGVPNGPSWSEDFAIMNMDCVAPMVEKTCVDLGLIGVSGLLPSEMTYTSEGVGYCLSNGPSGTTASQMLLFNGGQTLKIYFPQPIAQLELELGTATTGLTVNYYQLVADDDLVYSEVLVQTEILPNTGNDPIALDFENTEQPISLVVIESESCESTGGGGANVEDFPCSKEIMADLMGLMNGLIQTGLVFSESAVQLNTQALIPILYKYLTTCTFNLCNEPMENSGNQNLLTCLLNGLPDVTFKYVPFAPEYGKFVIDIPGCITFYIEVLLPDELQNSVVAFECFSMFSDISDGKLGLFGDAILNDGSKEGFRAWITYQLGDGSFGEPVDCNSMLTKLCYFTYEDYLSNVLAEEVNSTSNAGDDINIMMSNVGQVIWKPEKTYTVDIQTATRIFKDGTNLVETFNQSYQVQFRTEGPPGFFHQFPGGTFHPQYAALPEELQTQFKQKDLLHYIDLIHSYPNADGNLINAKPIFYENVELGLFFKQAYIRTMYDAGWGSYELGLEIKDPAAIAEEGTVPFQEWADGPIIETTEMIAVTQNLDGVECLGVEVSGTASQGAIFLKDLEPLKCYTAVYSAIRGGESREVHRYTFETSRYATFEEMVMSHVITAENDASINTFAAFVIEKDWAGISLPAGGDDVLAYEQALFGTLGLADLPPANTTEFLILKDAGSSNVVGLLVRNPEPFNDPKIPVSILEDGIDLTFNGSALGTKIVAKDSSAILFPGGGSFPGNGEVTIAGTFRYKKYDANSGTYVDDQTVAISFTKTIVLT